MVVRRYGPVRGAGVQLEEKEGEKPIEAAAIGFVGYTGIFEKGMVGELIPCLSKTAFLRQCGSYTPDSLAPDAAIDYFDGAAGAGGLYAVRVTDGNELPAEAALYMRKNPLTQMGTIKAKNGGRWGGKDKDYTNDVSAETKVTNVTLDTEIATFKNDEWKGGWLEMNIIPNKKYALVGSTEAGVVTLVAGSTLKDDWTAVDPTYADKRYYLYLENEDKRISYRIRDGEERAASEFALDVFVDGALVKPWPNLSVDDTSPLYWESIINDDGGNDWIEVEDLITGARTAEVRPANHWGEIKAVTETVMTAVIHDFAINSPGGGDPTFALGTTDDLMVAQKITVTMSSPTAGAAVSDKLGALGDVTLGALFTPNNKWAPPFTVTAGTNPLVASDTLVVSYKPFTKDLLIGGSLYVDKPNAPRVFFRIVDNDHESVTVPDGSDLTADGAIADEFMVVAPLELAGGRDGVADLVDADYNQQAWDTGVSPFNGLADKGLGIVKLATPGVTATAVQKAGVAYGAARNHPYRYEILPATVTEAGADEYCNDTLGRNDFAVVSFPSYGYVADPEAGGSGVLKLVTLTGQIHGREAAIAKAWDGYHKAEAGEDAILPKVLKLPTGDTALNEEYLNPLGINVIKKKKGNFVLWGDRTLALDTNWKWKHQREIFSYYEHVLSESFDWIVFAINDPISQKPALSALQSFFLPEWRKRAIRGDSLQDAAILKIDAEINTDATRAAGDMYADISLLLADTVERFKIRIGKQGIFESVG